MCFMYINKVLRCLWWLCCLCLIQLYIIWTQILLPTNVLHSSRFGSVCLHESLILHLTSRRILSVVAITSAEKKWIFWLVTHQNINDLRIDFNEISIPQFYVGSIGKIPDRIILWCPTIEMLIEACFLVQPLEQEGGYQKCCISLWSELFINHFYQMKTSPESLNILIHWSK